MTSIWMEASSTAPQYPELVGDHAADVAVIGAGIAGVTTALLLAELGRRRVALIDAGCVAQANTGRSTGNLYSTVSKGLAVLREKWSTDQVATAVAIRARAVDEIESRVARLGLDCGFRRQPLYLGLADEDPVQRASIEREYEALAALGLEPQWTQTLQVGRLRPSLCLRIDGQAQLNPYLYTVGLAAAAAAAGVAIFERSAVVEVDAGEGRVSTARGSVRAQTLVLATHSPLGFNLIQAEMEPYREYGIAGRTPTNATMPELTDGIVWLRGPSRSLRRYNGRLVVVGEKHRTGEADPQVDYVQRLKRFAQRQFGLEELDFSWSAQQFQSADGLPYVGESGHRNVLIATGFGADGLTWGTVAARLLFELIEGKASPEQQLLRPRRFTPVKSAAVWASENAAVLKHLIGDRLGDDVSAIAGIAPGSGAIVEACGRKCAAYCGTDGRLTLLSPVCPHMKCHVAWNPAEATWDCPCHGSRFHPDGRVLEGPAMTALEPIAPVVSDAGSTPETGL